jgi:ATP-binding cassette, subfamily B, bacterial
VAPSLQALPSKQNARVLRELLSGLSRKRFFLVTLWQTIEACAMLLLPTLAGLLAGYFSAGQNVTTPMLLLALALSAQTAMTVLAGLQLNELTLMLSAHVREWVFAQVQHLDYQVYLKRSQGDYLSLIVQDAATVSAFFAQALPTLLPTCLSFGVASIMVFRSNPGLASAILLSMLVFVVVLRLLGRKIRAHSKQVQLAHARAISTAEQAIELLPAIRASNATSHFSQLFSACQHQLNEAARALRLRMLLIAPVSKLLISLGALLLLGLSVRHTETLAQATTLFLYASLMAAPLARLGELYAQWNGALGALDRLSELSVLPPEDNGVLELQLQRGEICFESVDFSWSANTPLIQNFSLRIAAGSWLAITGDNGSGKSSLLALLTGLVVPERGRILLDGQDIALCTRRSLRAALRYVPQQSWISFDSIAANIRFGQAELDPQALALALKISEMDVLLANLPSGINTTLGPRGMTLSGGQQQKLALARALARPGSIIVLDEATSMFDTAAQSRFFENAKAQLRGCTVIFVAHDANLLRFADQVVHLSAST